MKKYQIKRILIPVDFTETSEAATSRAVTLAKLFKAEIFLIHVIEFSGYYFSVIPETQIMLPSILEIEKGVKNKMEMMQKIIKRQSGIMPQVYITTGSIHSEVISFSENKKIDLIVMGTHGAAGYKELFIGSNAQRVVSLSEIPVLTMQKKSSKTKFKNILIPIDNSLHSREKVNLAMIIAEKFGARIHVVGLPDSNDKQELDKFKIKCESVENIIRTGKLQYKITFVHGKNLAQSAMNYASKNKCDLIIINTGHESKSTGIFLGAFAQQIVNHSKVPVLSFRHSEGYFTIDTPGFGIG